MRLGVVQIDHDVDDRAVVHRNTIAAIEDAARRGVEFLLFPELFSTGYIPNFELWNRIEAGAGFIGTLRRAARDHAMYIGSGHAEVLGGEIVNSYVVIDPSGTIVGRAVKESAEAYIFRRGRGAHLVGTDFGTVTVGICADNHVTQILESVRRARPVLHLMPHAWPTPFRRGFLVSGADITRAAEDFRDFPVAVARYVAAPTVFVNQLGDLPPMAGLFRHVMSPRRFRLQGGSRIIGSDGAVVASLGSEEGMALADVALDRSPSGVDIPDHDGWAHRGSTVLRRVVIPVESWRGQRVYERRLRARASRPPAEGPR